MIDIYTYYSVGGYKDLYLGSTNDSYESAFYSPFVEMYRNGEKFDNRTNSQMELLLKLPQIEFLSNATQRKLPPTAVKIETRGGYKCIFFAVEGGYSLIIREIENGSQDEFGRPIPFLVQFVGTDEAEIGVLSKYVCENLSTFEKLLSEILHYNAEYNALECELGKLNSEIRRIILDYSEKFDKEPTSRKIKCLILANPSEYSIVVKKLGFHSLDVHKVYGFDGKYFVPKSTVLDFDDRESKVCINDPISIDSSSHDKNNNTVFSTVMKLLSELSFDNPEDRKDIDEIKRHFNNIINRRIL